MASIEIIDYENANGRLKEIYDDIISKRGKLAEVHKIQSLNPESIVAHMNLYLEIMFGQSPLKRTQREMLAVIVSSTNKCNYCIQHHAIALNSYWKDTEKVNQLIIDYQNVELSNVDLKLCLYAQILTKNPESSLTKNIIDYLKEKEVSDRVILDATLIISYFNFVNRMVLGLGVNFTAEEANGYNY